MEILVEDGEDNAAGLGGNHRSTVLHGVNDLLSGEPLGLQVDHQLLGLAEILLCGAGEFHIRDIILLRLNIHIEGGVGIHSLGRTHPGCHGNSIGLFSLGIAAGSVTGACTRLLNTPGFTGGQHHSPAFDLNRVAACRFAPEACHTSFLHNQLIHVGPILKMAAGSQKFLPHHLQPGLFAVKIMPGVRGVHIVSQDLLCLTA